MLFNQIEFIFLFLPAVVLVFFAVPWREARAAVLAAMSLLFYLFSGFEHLFVLVGGALWTYVIASGRGAKGSKRRLALAIAGPACALLFYKYAGFLVGNLAALGAFGQGAPASWFTKVVLPAGISFFTFEFIAYAIDRYRGEIATPPGFLNFLVYVAFFPHLVAGPIVRYGQVAEAISGLRRWRAGVADWSEGAALAIVGLAMKVLLADAISSQIAPFVAEPGKLTPLAAAATVLGFSFQIYFDFFGYSLIAIGIARFFGFRLPENFRDPYTAPNPREFWRRWHMTLSFWIRDYLYKPLGGNERYGRNILIVFALCGLWHGAGWNFIVWGLYHAFLVIGYGAVERLWTRLPVIAQSGLTFVLVSAGWILFLFDFGDAVRVASSLLGRGTNALTAESPDLWLLIATCAFFCFVVNPVKLVRIESSRAGVAIAYSAGMGLFLLVTVMAMERSASFIYFRF